MAKFLRHKIVFFLAILLSCGLFPGSSRILPAAGPWDPLAGIIRQQLNPGNRPVGEVSLVQGNVAIIRLYGPLPIGTTLAVKGNNLPGVPLALQDNIARIKLTQATGLQARGTILPGSRPVPPRAPLFPLTHNRVYLYTNLAAPQNLRPFQDLVRTLQYNRITYALKSGPQLAAGDVPGIRPLIITFEATGPQITCRLTDRDQNVFYENSFALAFAPPVISPAGAPLAQASAGFGNVPSGSVSGPTSFTKATGPAPGTEPVGRIKLKNGYSRLVFLEYDGRPGRELALLNAKWVEIYRIENLKLVSIAHFRLPYNDLIPLHLHAGDFNHNGRDEIYVTLGRPKLIDNKLDTGLYSLILESKKGGRAPQLLARDLPYYFRVIEIRNGKKVLMVQKMGEFKQYQVPIRWAGFYNGKFAVRTIFRQARDVFSLYNFNLNPFNDKQILVLDEKGNLAGFNAKTSELLLTADNNYGVFDETPYNQKLKEVIYEGGFTITQTAATRYTARRFIKRNSYGRQIFLIKKRREVNPNLKDKALALVTDNKVKTDQVIGIQWRGDDIRETWKSPRFPRDIIDFGCTRINNTETMVIMTRNQNKRYALELLH
jgi:hypothetical protein